MKNKKVIIVVVAIIAIITAFLGIWNNNDTKGLDGFKDKEGDK